LPVSFRTTGVLGLKIRVDAATELNQWNPLVYTDGFADGYDFSFDTFSGGSEFFRVVAE